MQLKERQNERKDEEEDVCSYCISLREREDEEILSRKPWITLFGKFALEEAMSLSQSRRLISISLGRLHIQILVCLVFLHTLQTNTRTSSPSIQ
jgi:hypothetical protein